MSKEKDISINLFLNSIGFEMKNVKGDGNCFFRSISHYLSISHEQARSDMVKMMAQNPKLYEIFYEEPYCQRYSIISDNVTAINIYDRIERMYSDKQWAGFIERFAAAFYLEKNVVELEQYDNNFRFWKIFVCEKNIDTFENWQNN